jgi:hypothetical protein
MAGVQHVGDVFKQLRKVIDIPKTCREVTIHLSVDAVPTVTAVYFPENADFAEGPITQRFRLEPLPDDNPAPSR